jgi:glycogen synthase
VLLVTTEVVGPVSNGGIGTAYTTMAHTLRAAGHLVTILFTMGPVSQHGPFEDWVKHYAEQGIELVGLYHPPVRYLPRHMLESYEVSRFLRDRPEFDIVHFHDYQGAGYYSLLAKHQGYPELANMTTVVGLHGPNLWAKSVGNQVWFPQKGTESMGPDS